MVSSRTPFASRFGSCICAWNCDGMASPRTHLIRALWLQQLCSSIFAFRLQQFQGFKSVGVQSVWCYTVLASQETMLLV